MLLNLWQKKKAKSFRNSEEVSGMSTHIPRLEIGLFYPSLLFLPNTLYVGR